MRSTFSLTHVDARKKPFQKKGFFRVALHADGRNNTRGHVDSLLELGELFVEKGIHA